MSSRKVRKKNRLWFVFANIILFGIGFYILDEISTWYEIPLGSDFYVILGCTVMASSGVYIIYSIKKIYFTKGKKKSNPTFLKKDEIKNHKK
jgi:hypothetical protein